ncbi:MAG: RHS repeat-associated core domain-containing protein [Deltaproteobacteria bacterium]|nr:RHS repeat-associated core domain-containing protein [Deltaproteobacteria bacterium]
MGTRVQLIEYDPWGKVSREEGIGDSVRRFTGKQLDPESGLYYYGGRYYDADLGRFISPDPFVGQPDDPQNLNRYSYVGNNPVNYIDPSGFKKKKKKGFFSSFFFKIFVSIVAAVIAAPIASAIAGAVASAVGATAATAAAVATVAGNVAAGAAAGAAAAGLSGGNVGVGAAIGGAFGLVVGGLGGGGSVGSDIGGGLSPGLIGSGAAQFADFFAGRQNGSGSGRRGGSAEDDFSPNLVLASHTGVPFGCMNPVARCEPPPPSNPQTQPPKPVLPDRKALDVDLCKQCRPPVVDRIPEICVSQGNLCIRGEPAGIPPAERPLTAPEILRRGLQRQLEGP